MVVQWEITCNGKRKQIPVRGSLGLTNALMIVIQRPIKPERAFFCAFANFLQKKHYKSCKAETFLIYLRCNSSYSHHNT